ncbi:ELP5 protein, partial [Alopecoenas beccarii]|nr:ELP5 protein [Alopecoenas beccarii]
DPLSPFLPAPPRVLALLHEDLHPPPLLRALGGIASTQLFLGGPPGAPRVARVVTRPPRMKDETFALLPDGSLGAPQERPPTRTPGSPGDLRGPPRTPGSPGDLGGPSPITFRLGVSAAEQAARAALTPPYRISP